MLCWALVIPLAVLLTDGLVAAQTESLTCHTGYFLNAAENNNTCFRVFEERHVTRSEARDLCRASIKDGDLLQVDSIQSNQMVADKLSRGKRYWIGVIKNGDDDAIIDETETPVPFEAPWAWGEPNDHGKQDERCVEMIGNRRGAWNDKRCDKKRPFVCQAPAVTVFELSSCDFETQCFYEYDKTVLTLVTNDTSLVDHTLQSPEGHYLSGINGNNGAFAMPAGITVAEPSCLTLFFRGKYAVVGYYDGDRGAKTINNTASSVSEGWNKFMGEIQTLENEKIFMSVKAVDDIRLESGPCDA